MFIPAIERDGDLYKHEDAVIEKECLLEIIERYDKYELDRDGLLYELRQLLGIWKG